MPDVTRLVKHLRQALAAHRTASEDQPLIIVDGYHGFGAIPTDLSAVAADCCYVACGSQPPSIMGSNWWHRRTFWATASNHGIKLVAQAYLLVPQHQRSEGRPAGEGSPVRKARRS